MTAVEMLKMSARETWNKIYALINWRNRPSTATALGATNLNKMDVAINMLDNRVIQLQAEKLGIDVANLMVSSWVMDMKTYKITVTQLNGTVKEYDLNLERIPVDISLSEEGILTFTYADGTSESVNVADLIKNTVYDESETITFEKNFRDDVYHVTATIKNNSIEERHLKTEVMQDIRNNANIAQAAVNDALTYSKDSKRWAVGDAEYEGSDTDNSKYYKEQAESAKAAAEKARDEAQAATGAAIMTPEKVGVGKPDNQTIGVEEDGTIKMIAKAASLLITDTQGLAGDKNAETNTQLLINAIADKITTSLVTNEALTQKLASYMTKSMMSNVQVNDQNKVPTSALANAMQQAITKNAGDITKLNSDLSNVIAYEQVSDANLATKFGRYRVSGSGANIPNWGGGVDLLVLPYEKGVAAQIAIFNGTTSKLAIRAMPNGTFGPWIEYATRDEVQNGTSSLPEAIPANSSKTLEISFPKSFNNTPTVCVCLVNDSKAMLMNRASAHVRARYVDRFIVEIQNGSDSQIKPAVSWIATT